MSSNDVDSVTKDNQDSEIANQKQPTLSPTSMDGKAVEETLSKILGNETVYELSGQRRLDSPTSHVVSERVHSLASQIYTELQKIINRCSEDEEIVGGLMPLIVNVLESLDLAIIESQQLQVELELCKDDNDQLVSAFDKEKAHKKKIEQRLLEYEFQTEEDKQKFTQKIMSLENIVKMLELKAKNASDHSARLEEKENELKVENTKIHSRYNELLRSHCDLMERMKILIDNEDTSNTGPQSFGTYKPYLPKKSDFESMSSQFGESMEVNSTRNISSSTLAPRQAWIDTDLSLEDASIIEDVDEIPRDKYYDREKDNQSITGRPSHQIEHASAVSDNFFGMEKEVQNLIKENDELLATKNALNIVKDDLIAKVDELQSDLTMARDEVQLLTAVKDKLQSRISSLEEDHKKTREQVDELQQKLAAQKEDDGEGLPVGQRKRFTRLEMAKVLQERNKYKEAYMDAIETIKWSEVIRGNKPEGEKKSAIWKFFSNLFSASSSTAVNPSNRSPSKAPAIRYDPSSSSQVAPALDVVKRRTKINNSGDSFLLMDSLLDADSAGERARSLKAVQARVNRTNGDRIIAYGWSIAGNTGDPSSSASDLKHTTVPVPIYCRPLNTEDMGMKIWCAASVDLTGGEAGFPDTNIINRSDSKMKLSSIGDNKKGQSDGDNLFTAITDLENDLEAAEHSCFPDPKKLSAFGWICSVSHSRSKVSVVNIKNNPSELLDSFIVKTHLLCIASVPGAKNNDLYGFDNVDMTDITLIEADAEPTAPVAGRISKPEQSGSREKSTQESSDKDKESENTEKGHSPKNDLLEKLTDYVAYTEPPSPTPVEEIDTTNSIYQPLSTCLPTMWLGGQNGILYVHSGLAQWSHCLARVKLPDSILQIVHFKGKVFVALANGQCCIFTRLPTTGCWDFSKYFVLNLGEISAKMNGTSPPAKTGSPTSSVSANFSIRCMEVTKMSVWLGYRNTVYILDCNALKIVHSFAVDPRKETQVRQLTAMEDGVWCSIRLDSTIRLYSAVKPYQHVQDIDIEPLVTKLLGSKSFSFERITALKASNNRLWVGTYTGVILSIPCDRCPTNASNKPSIVSDSDTGNISLTSYLPKGNPSQAQLSFHGHKDAVKFFVMAKNLIMSGGEGYIDFRSEPDDESDSIPKGDRSHVIVWEINS
ncbi:JNK-interacting protein 3-like isoform X2 [Brevipalpus obovatus]|uniref:JNK-interacting protein 3-like isoform X2 n=1 Tax=Brevipalpus obovatus TaxID=246614 RepID=UPI003D9F1A08